MWGCVWRNPASLLDMLRLASRPDARVHVMSAGLACCSLEFEAAVATGLLVEESGVSDAPSLASILVVAGTITHALEPAVEKLYADLAEHAPVRVMSFGACATSGGPYWDAPTVAPGLGSLPVESYVPGCPPRPEALVAELERLVDSMALR